MSRPPGGWFLPQIAQKLMTTLGKSRIASSNQFHAAYGAATHTANDQAASRLHQNLNRDDGRQASLL